MIRLENDGVRSIDDLIYNRALEHKKIIKHPNCDMKFCYFEAPKHMPKCGVCNQIIWMGDFTPKEIEKCCKGRW